MTVGCWLKANFVFEIKDVTVQVATNSGQMHFRPTADGQLSSGSPVVNHAAGYIVNQEHPVILYEKAGIAPS